LFYFITGILFFVTFTFLPSESAVVITKSSSGLSSANYVKEDHHDGDNQQNMNETAHGVGGDQPQEPQDDQNDSDSP
jgi:hypothetical protein